MNTEKDLCNGFTLIELMITLVVIGLLAALVLPLSFNFVKRHRQNNVKQQLIVAINFTRQQAWLRHEMLSLCPSFDGSHCDDNWNHELIVKTQTDQVIQHFSQHHLGRLVWRGFAKTASLKFPPEPQQGTLNGRFSYMDKGETQPVWQLVLSRNGRVRL